MKTLITLLLAGSFTCAFAQDPFYTDQVFGYSSLNPALTGTFGSLRTEAGYRLQWPQLAGNYQTATVAADMPTGYGNYGFNFMYDAAGGGTITTTREDLNIAVPIVFAKDSTGKGKLVIQPAVQVSIQSKRIDWSRLTFGDMIDPRRGFVYNTSETPNVTTKTNIDFSAGLLAYTNRIAIGAALYHIIEPDEGFLGPSKLPMRTVLHASGVIGNTDAGQMNAFRLVPSVVYMQQADFHQLVFNATAHYRGFRLGAGIRTDDALLFNAGYSFWKCTVAYSYDLTYSKGLAGMTGGSHEVHVRFSFLENKLNFPPNNMRMYY
jgi:type IX secretion system PorP/SprF family membrane protein